MAHVIKSNKQWEEDDDARTLMRATEIMNNKGKLAGAKRGVRRIEAETKKTLKTITKVKKSKKTVKKRKKK